jgi:hypothetical protein
MSLRPVLLGFVVLLVTGCAWRASGAEHYIGPVLFRYSDDGTAVHQVRALGLFAEAGRQWALTLGFVDRVAVSAHGADADAPAPVRWTAAGVGALAPARWHLSPFYLRGDDVAAPHLVFRQMFGAQIGAGDEVNAVSLGVIARAHVTPPDDAAVVVHFRSGDPLATRLTIWNAAAGTLPAAAILEEAQR